eukprot:CAMPEP_0194776474 /NCGR_PEP_ID=MMETSP0323_2-20130528/63187_1 /TAXON_ID=2866 ORGANISM="Crypthecodinium cohnii, Strain Seligo" /NCGR_SAMPLE_ID=MMETSP0323_2 /ASSEMBLY_ACC=CAM_ASM_000346 /LENGTH=185 /DNA_ID=CAMNT_0039712901 /DNA_START=330 /DNA_END=887 /DNA_ORIENTATION=-
MTRSRHPPKSTRPGHYLARFGSSLTTFAKKGTLQCADSPSLGNHLGLGIQDVLVADPEVVHVAAARGHRPIHSANGVHDVAHHDVLSVRQLNHFHQLALQAKASIGDTGRVDLLAPALLWHGVDASRAFGGDWKFEFVGLSRGRGGRGGHRHAKPPGHEVYAERSTGLGVPERVLLPLLDVTATH